MIEQIEKNIFFKITRIFAWIIIVPAFLILLYSGYKSLKSLIPPSSPVVTYDEVKSIMEGKANYSDFEGRKIEKSTKGNKDDFNKALNYLIDTFDSETLDKSSGAMDKNDFIPFVDGLKSVIKSAPENNRHAAAVTYLNIWLTKKNARNSEASSDVINKPFYLGLLAGTLFIISVFSLVLILLTIEKNTRKAEKS